MLYALIALLVIICVLAYLYYKQRKETAHQYVNSCYWHELYKATEKGFTEVTDAYQTDMLQYEEMIEAKTEMLDLSQDALAVHIENAQIDAIARREQAATIDSLRRRLDIAQVIIAEHDLNCLPHIVLTAMEAPKTQ